MPPFHKLCQYLLSTQHSWSNSPTAQILKRNDHQHIINTNSTTKRFQMADMKATFKQHQLTTTSLTQHQLKNYNPISHRGVTIYLNDKPSMICFSWLATNDPLVFQKFKELKNQSLGDLLFDQQQPWQRSDFQFTSCEFSGHILAGRRSDFRLQQRAHLHLLEFFL